MRNIERRHQLYGRVSLLGRALGHETRLELLELLSQCPQTVEKLAATLDHDVKAVSAHLKVLAKAGLVAATREGRFMRYALKSPKVAALAVLLRETAEQIDRDLAGLVHEVVPKAHVDLRQAVDAAGRGQIVLIDVRPAEEYAAGHLPNAVSMPLDELEARMGELAQDAVLVAYCRGPYCFQALEAKKIFEAHGRRASWNGRAAARRSRSRRPEAERLRARRLPGLSGTAGRVRDDRERQGAAIEPPLLFSRDQAAPQGGRLATVVNRPRGSCACRTPPACGGASCARALRRRPRGASR